MGWRRCGFVHNIFQPSTAVHLVVCNAPGTICYGVSQAENQFINSNRQ